MSTKKVDIPDLGSVSLYRRRGTTQMKLSVTRENEIRVVLPIWAPYRMGVEFARAKADWIRAQQVPQTYITDHMPVGKAHHFAFSRSDGARPSARVSGNAVIVHIPMGADPKSTEVQQAAKRAGIRALKKEAATLLPQRLAQLAELHGFDYQDVTIKPLKGRWGSCSQHREIILNCYLMQLPWPLIDYVLLHELVHTRIMAHGQPFWAEVARYVDNLPEIRRQMRGHHPDFFTHTGILQQENSL